MSKICSNKTATKVCKILKGAGKDCYVVGGAVRDDLLGNNPKDLDFTTNATPDEVTKIFEESSCKVIPTGIEHGTVTVHCEGEEPAEITTYRIEGKYSDGRHPDSVSFAKSIEEDLSRRDLTINAMARDPISCKLVDPYGGQKDLKEGVIKAVGNATDRFKEDGLRPFRAARFASKYGFKIAEDTIAAMSKKEVHDTASKVAMERVRDEFMKALATNNPRQFIEVLDQTGLLLLMLPEMEAMKGMPQPKAHHVYDVWNHSLGALEAMKDRSSDPFMRFVALLHDVGKPATYNNNPEEPHFYGHDKEGSKIIEEIMLRLKFSAKEIETAKSLVLHHLQFYESKWNDAKIRRWVNEIKPENVDNQINLAYADLKAHGKKEDELALIPEFEDRLKSISNPSMTTRDLAISGKDIIDIKGIKPGPEVGRLQKALLDRVIEDPSLNSRESLTEILSTI